jgi:chemotaxis protein MotB
MALRRRGGATAALNPWPGYVDALSTLLMVLVFVLLVFVLAQAFLSVALSGRDQALDRLGRQVAELADMLSLEKGHSADLTASVAQLTQDLQAARAARDAAVTEAAGLKDALAKTQDARDAVAAADVTLKARLSDQAAELDSAQKRLAAAQARLAETADKASAENLARLSDQVRALLALRDQLGAQVSSAADANRALQAKLADSTRLADSAQAQVALLTKQVEALRAQLSQVAAALELARTDARAKDARIADLGAKLNEALVSKVAELQRYRSEFFGRLRDVLAGRPGITVVGDRFVFQSEVLFPAGSADLSPAGTEQIRKLAATLKDLAGKIPPDLPWVLRVDGHADRQAVRGKFASNWELSAERAINVVRLLVAEGVPANRLAAAGFGEFQPLDAAATPAAYAKNRRIELRLTDR